MAKIKEYKSSVQPMFHVTIKIEGATGTGKSQVRLLIWKALADAKWPHGMDARKEHEIYCSLPD